jgi:hypothetical protein
MSYHDGYDRPMMEGISVVNPIIEIQKKLIKIRELIEDKDDSLEDLTVNDLKGLIENILNE